MSISNEQRESFNERYIHLFNALNIAYQKARPKLAPDCFRKRVYNNLLSYFGNNPQAAFVNNGMLDEKSIFEVAQRIEELPAPVDAFIIYTASAYGMAAAHALLRQDLSAAWNAMSDASFRLGWAMSVAGGPEIYSHALLRELLTSQAKAGAAGRHKETNQLKQESLSILAASGPFATYGAAVQHVRARLAKADRPCTVNTDTLTNWIKEWLETKPDSTPYILSREKHLSSGNKQRRGTPSDAATSEISSIILKSNR